MQSQPNENRSSLRKEAEQPEEENSDGNGDSIRQSMITNSMISHEADQIPLIDRIKMGPLSKYTKYSKPLRFEIQSSFSL